MLGGPEPGHLFKLDFLDYLKGCINLKVSSRDNTLEELSQLVNEFDFSSVKAALVKTVPGEHHIVDQSPVSNKETIQSTGTSSVVQRSQRNDLSNRKIYPTEAERQQAVKDRKANHDRYSEKWQPVGLGDLQRQLEMARKAYDEDAKQLEIKQETDSVKEEEHAEIKKEEWASNAKLNFKVETKDSKGSIKSDIKKEKRLGNTILNFKTEKKERKTPIKLEESNDEIQFSHEPKDDLENHNEKDPWIEDRLLAQFSSIGSLGEKPDFLHDQVFRALNGRNLGMPKLYETYKKETATIQTQAQAAGITFLQSKKNIMKKELSQQSKKPKNKTALFFGDLSRDLSRAELIWPTINNIRESLPGYISAQALFCRSRESGRKILGMWEYLQHEKINVWKSQRAGRERIMPHVKTYMRVDGTKYGNTVTEEQQGDLEAHAPLRWVLQTSANMSRGAWGYITRPRAGIVKIQPENYELGVLIYPQLFKSGKDDKRRVVMVPVYKKDRLSDPEAKQYREKHGFGPDTLLVCVRMPYDLDTKRYHWGSQNLPGSNRQPDWTSDSAWVTDYQGNAPDLRGETWSGLN